MPKKVNAETLAKHYDFELKQYMSLLKTTVARFEDNFDYKKAEKLIPDLHQIVYDLTKLATKARIYSEMCDNKETK